MLEDVREDSETQYAVRVEGVSISFPGFPVLDNVSMAVQTGTCTLIMGSSGSGKSTLLKAAAGLILADCGTVEILGVNIDSAGERDLLSARRRNGFVFQDAALWQNMSVYQNLALPMEYHLRGVSRERIDARIAELTRRLGFTDDLALRPAALSAGEQKIISLVRALVLAPELLFLDEPTSFVDTRGIDSILAELRAVKRSGTTIVAVTHNALIASQLADNLVVLKDGHILDSGPIHSVVQSRDPEVLAVLSDVLAQGATFDQDLLGLLELNEEEPIG